MQRGAVAVAMYPSSSLSPPTRVEDVPTHTHIHTDRHTNSDSHTHTHGGFSESVLARTICPRLSRSGVSP
ncbi:unnamed protein product [Protopolystoma xenopodis]|uniref:Uncharacterized protein n=1 Tax=Protopolystoma xenopodis TaxID=117903 RepID=A0A3S5AUR5_9PLAT|nr:unnamed protein product [Protopolystoma xenopodis]